MTSPFTGIYSPATINGFYISLVTVIFCRELGRLSVGMMHKIVCVLSWQYLPKSFREASRCHWREDPQGCLNTIFSSLYGCVSPVRSWVASTLTLLNNRWSWILECFRHWGTACVDSLGKDRWGQGKPGGKQDNFICFRRRTAFENRSLMHFACVSKWWSQFRSHNDSFDTSWDCWNPNVTWPNVQEFIVLLLKVWHLQRKYLSAAITDLWWLNQAQTGKKNQLTARDLGDKMLPSGYN